MVSSKDYFYHKHRYWINWIHLLLYDALIIVDFRCDNIYKNRLSIISITIGGNFHCLYTNWLLLELASRIGGFSWNKGWNKSCTKEIQSKSTANSPQKPKMGPKRLNSTWKWKRRMIVRSFSFGCWFNYKSSIWCSRYFDEL